MASGRTNGEIEADGPVNHSRVDNAPAPVPASFPGVQFNDQSDLQGTGMAEFLQTYPQQIHPFSSVIVLPVSAPLVQKDS